MTLYSLSFVCVHVTVHLFLYTVPRALWLVCVRWPLQVLQAVLGVRLLLRDPREERQVRVLGPVGAAASCAPAAAREQLGVAAAQLANPALHHDGVAANGPAWLRYAGPLYNGHVHTILGAIRPALDLREPEREVVPSYDGNPTCLDWWMPTPAETAAAAAAGESAAAMHVRALVVILPGLTGSSCEFYVRRMARQLLVANLAVCVVNARGVADTPLQEPQTFSAMFTKDIRYVMSHYLTREKVRDRLTGSVLLVAEPLEEKPLPILGVAFSLGGLILTNYVAEQGEANEPSGFDAVYTITAPHNVSDGAAALRSPLTNLLYGPTMYRGLRDYCLRHKEVIRNLPGINAERLFSGEKPLIDDLKTVQQFDELITGPHFGFSGAEAYYNHADNFRRMMYSQTPQVCVVAANDPICGPPQPVARWLDVIQRHEAGLVYVEMPVGGHLGFLMCPFWEWMQAPNEMENFVLYSINHWVNAAAKEKKAA